MSYGLFNGGSGGGGSPNNLNINPEFLGFTTKSGVSVSANGTAKTATWITIGTVTNDCTEFVLYCIGGTNATSSSRYVIDLSTDGATANLVADLGWTQASGNGATKFHLPLKLTAGQTVSAKASSSTSGGTLIIGIETYDKNSDARPGFTSGVNLSAGTNNAGTPTFLLDDGTTLNWQAAITATAKDYGGLLLTTTESVSGNGQTILVAFGYGSSSASVTEVGRFFSTINTSSPNNPRSWSEFIPKLIPSGTNIYVRGSGPAGLGSGSDALHVGIIGFS